MKEKPSIELLDYKIEEMTKMIKEGFDGVHARQDKTNGNVKANTEFRIQHEEVCKVMKEDIDLLKGDRESRFKKYSDLFWKVGTAVLAASLGIQHIL